MNRWESALLFFHDTLFWLVFWLNCYILLSLKLLCKLFIILLYGFEKVSQHKDGSLVEVIIAILETVNVLKLFIIFQLFSRLLLIIWQDIQRTYVSIFKRTINDFIFHWLTKSTCLKLPFDPTAIKFAIFEFSLQYIQTLLGIPHSI